MTAPPHPEERHWLGAFLVFALAYFLSALLRAVTATLAPSFSAEFGLGAADLGLLAGAYFLGFALLQLPLGSGLDRHGPRRVEIGLLLLAILGCAVFAASSGFAQLVLGRLLIGMGVAACLMAPLTYFRLHFGDALQLQCNSWMLMTGSLGMVASTVPVQLALPALGWRGLFWLMAVLLAVGAVLLALRLPADRPAGALGEERARGRYWAIAGHREFLRLAPIGLLLHGGLLALQALWFGPWLTRVCGWSPEQASAGLLLVNVGMLCAFLGWGWLLPRLLRRGWSVHGLLSAGVPISLALLLLNAWLGEQAQAWHWMLWCVATSVVAFGQPALAQAFPVQMAGRALSAYNLVIFGGVFLLQWGIGAGVDLLQATGVAVVDAFRLTVAGFGVLALLGYLWFLGLASQSAHNRTRPT